MRMIFIFVDLFYQSMEAHFTHFLLNLTILTFDIKINKDFYHVSLTRELILYVALSLQQYIQAT